MKILIIGGTRFFGYHLTKKLIESGHEVALFNRGITPHDFGQRVEHIQGDRYDYQGFFGKLHRRKFDAVVDMVAFRAEDSRSAVRTFLSNIKHFIHISTAAVYVVAKDYPCPLQEKDFDRQLYPQPKRNDELWNYGYHKRKCEEVLREAYRKRVFPVTIFRLPIVIGERDYTLRAYSYFIRIKDKKPVILPDSGLNVFTHIYQGDVVKTISSNLLNESAIGEAYNLAQEEIVTLRSFVIKAAEIMNKKVQIVDIPSRVLENTPLGTSFSPFSMRRPFVLQTLKAREALNFTSTPFDVWLKKTIHWFEEEYKGGPPDNYKLRNKEIEIVRKYQKAVTSIH
ncbi:MAG: NAD-dependent epimerase/dehydratase family protein [Candidatus Aminicenantaceae bacterium]